MNALHQADALRIASSDEASPSQLADFLNLLEDHFDIALTAARNPACPPKALHQLSHGDKLHQILAANSPYADPTDLERLAQSADPDVRLAIAQNPGTPQAVLATMYTNTPELREALLSNPALPDDLLDGVRVSELPTWRVWASLCLRVNAALGRRVLDLDDFPEQRPPISQDATIQDVGQEYIRWFSRP